MNNFTIFTSKKNYDFKATTPKQCAKLFIQKYPKFNQKFSVYKHSNKQIYGFFHKNQFLQSGSGSDDVKMLYLKNGSTNTVINDITKITDNDIQELKKRNKAYSTISIPLDASLEHFQTFGKILHSISKPSENQIYLIQDFLKTIIYKLQFINDKNELEKYLEIVKQFNGNTIIKKAVEKYLPKTVESEILNGNKIKNSVIDYNKIIQNLNSTLLATPLTTVKASSSASASPSPSPAPTSAPTLPSPPIFPFSIK